MLVPAIDTADSIPLAFFLYDTPFLTYNSNVSASTVVLNRKFGKPRLFALGDMWVGLGWVVSISHGQK
jgi:hypothetical protein